MDIIYLTVAAVVCFLLVLALNKLRNAPGRRGSTEQDITDAVKDGNTIEAIKHYRYVHGVTLREAKLAVAAMQDNT